MSQLFELLQLQFAIPNIILTFSKDDGFLIVVIEAFYVLMNLVNIWIRILEILVYLLSPFADLIFVPNQKFNLSVVKSVINVTFLDKEFVPFFLHFDFWWLWFLLGATL